MRKLYSFKQLLIKAAKCKTACDASAIGFNAQYSFEHGKINFFQFEIIDFIARKLVIYYGFTF